MRRYGNPPISGQKYTLRPGAYAVLPRDGKLLVTFQATPEAEFQLPGGGIDPGEGAVQALHREVWEETGWAISGARRLGAYRRFVWMPEYEIFAEKLCHVYLARPVLRRDDPMEPAHTAVWLEPDVALELIASDGDRAFLASLI
ncbi:NUDIX domain-containing protein [Pseudooceanicola algae]|uniref:Uncharacterized protein n=1 Tax=Pseudooceanicola algae TaxID=1537215 RepID=A0A418SBF7_9RHOB|nr:NUDIX hydrolase [Pseudooceanicola algae]QPM91454.1 hypothetical protein PSAL_027070 [Pseudooceanicola algae]